ncbi:AbiV family abortive infection protein [Promicromonospora soli]
MEARVIREIVQVPVAERATVLAEGLELLVEHVAELQHDSQLLRESGRERGAAILDLVRGEEAAKALILVDAMRLGWADGDAASKHLRKFIDHVARGIYLEMYHGRPATLGEVRRYVDEKRRSHYLDGPNDVDWNFRNEIEVEREEAFYVDYIKDDDGHRWVSPRDRFQHKAWGAETATELIYAMNRLGMFAATGLQHISSAWAGVEMRDGQHWSEHQKYVRKALVAIAEDGLVSKQATQDDIRRVKEWWIFPLGTLDLSKLKVKSSELEAQRQAVLDAPNRDMYGGADDY